MNTPALQSDRPGPLDLADLMRTAAPSPKQRTGWPLVRTATERRPGRRRSRAGPSSTRTPVEPVKTHSLPQSWNRSMSRRTGPSRKSCLRWIVALLARTARTGCQTVASLSRTPLPERVRPDAVPSLSRTVLPERVRPVAVPSLRRTLLPERVRPVAVPSLSRTLSPERVLAVGPHVRRCCHRAARRRVADPRLGARRWCPQRVPGPNRAADRRWAAARNQTIRSAARHRPGVGWSSVLL